MSTTPTDLPEWNGIIHFCAQYLASVSNLPNANPSDFENQAKVQYDTFCQRYQNTNSTGDSDKERDIDTGGEDADDDDDFLDEPDSRVLDFIAETGHLQSRTITSQQSEITHLKAQIFAIRKQSTTIEELRGHIMVKDALIEVMNGEAELQRDTIEELAKKYDGVKEESAVKEGVIRDIGEALKGKNEDIERLREKVEKMNWKFEG